ncbi:hypothetical protein QAD02_001805 [Eretmocerus hayati]|uniref:Uncharacterized protein n=1 Tax=Eretmocerus hayati TaxID=131215 RepID=A0ACC2NI00_9HYME|nr:hypothetical protein QAD02_001805 [Eretmocerus hayati]
MSDSRSDITGSDSDAIFAKSDYDSPTSDQESDVPNNSCSDWMKEIVKQNLSGKIEEKMSDTCSEKNSRLQIENSNSFDEKSIQGNIGEEEIHSEGSTAVESLHGNKLEKSMNGSGKYYTEEYGLRSFEIPSEPEDELLSDGALEWFTKVCGASSGKKPLPSKLQQDFQPEDGEDGSHLPKSSTHTSTSSSQQIDMGLAKLSCGSDYEISVSEHSEGAHPKDFSYTLDANSGRLTADDQSFNGFYNESIHSRQEEISRQSMCSDVGNEMRNDIRADS